MYDIIPDIHGQSEKLTARLTFLGYRSRTGAWRHSDPWRQVLFLGDFVDRGPNNAEVIDIVRRMIDCGTACAVMGNHELNAIHFHTKDPDNGTWLRPHSAKNAEQHASFLAEFPVDAALTKDVINWMKTLPLFIEQKGFRVVHACWDQCTIAALADETDDGRLSEDQLILTGKPGEKLCELAEITTKGPETTLPAGCSFRDKDGHERTEVRLQWWKGTAKTWADLAISVPDLSSLPTDDLPEHVARTVYPADAVPVFFGHYWLSGAPTLQAPNALCLDYSAGKDGPLVAYRLEDANAPLDLSNLVTD